MMRGTVVMMQKSAWIVGVHHNARLGRIIHGQDIAPRRAPAPRRLGSPEDFLDGAAGLMMGPPGLDYGGHGFGKDDWK